MYKQIYLHTYFLYYLAGMVFLFCLGFPFPFFLVVGKTCFVVFIGVLAVDFYFLFIRKNQLTLKRVLDEKLSNGDENPLVYQFSGNFYFQPELEIRDEYPVQLQIRDFSLRIRRLNAAFDESVTQSIVPRERGEYHFGKTHVLVSSVLKLVQRRYTFDTEVTVKVYPSFIQYRKYAFLTMNDRLQEVGVKKIRQLGGNTEFEQIREYVKGDDYRRINWRATARRQSLLVNHFDEEKAQHVYFIVDKGRMMHMPFGGMALFDYAINATLVLSGVASAKGDKAGLITFSNLIGSFISAQQGTKQISTITEALYGQETRNKESDFLRLYNNIRIRVKRRSLLVMFTNFESMITLERQMPYLQAIAKRHVLLMVIFKNTEIQNFSEQTVSTVKGMYDQTVAEDYLLEKERIKNALVKQGIYTVLTEPDQLTINTVNKYLEIKAKGLL